MSLFHFPSWEERKAFFIFGHNVRKDLSPSWTCQRETTNKKNDKNTKENTNFNNSNNIIYNNNLYWISTIHQKRFQNKKYR